MKTFFYVETNNGARGYDACITVYRVINNIPVLVGYDDKISYGSRYGAHAEACQIINRELGHKLASSYKLASKNIQVFELGSMPR